MIPVAAVIPTHRRPHLLAEAIGSVLAQRSAPAELIVVDDARDGPTEALVAAFAGASAVPIRYLAGDGPGACHSRNTGTQASRAPFVAFLDDDDIWHEDFLRLLGQRLADDPADLAISGIVRHERGAPPVTRAQPAGLTTATIFSRPASMTGSNFVIRRDSFLAVGGFDPAMTVFNDWDLLVRLVDAGMAYAVVPEALAEWRDHPGLRIASPSPKRAEGIERFIARYDHRLSARQKRDLVTTALGIRRAHAGSAREHALITARLALEHGLSGSIRRATTRLLPPAIGRRAIMGVE